MIEIVTGDLLEAKEKYIAHQCNCLTENSAWSNGNDKKAYLFLSDVCLGKSKIADRAHPYTLEGIKPHMSVWARAGVSLYNDEYIVYTERQNWLKFVVEFESLGR